MNMLGFGGVVFDLDATLVNLGRYVDWDVAHERIVQAYISYGCPENIVHSCSSAGLFSMMKKMWYNLNNQDDLPPLATQKKIYNILARYEMEGTERCSPLDGAFDIIKWLSQKEIPIGICTSNSQKAAERIIELLDWDAYIKVVIGRTPGVKMKPDPEQLLKCFKALNVRPVKGVMVGDSPDDMKAGDAAGCYNIGIPSFFNEPAHLTEAGANVLIDSLFDLKKIFRDLQL